MTFEIITSATAARAVAAILAANLAYAQCVTRDPAGASAVPSSVIGFYDWGGERPDDFSEGMAHLRELNARVARITLSARMDIDYRTGSQCIAGFSLPATLQRSQLRRVLTEPQLDVVMITAYDGAGFSDCATYPYLSPGFYTAENTRRVIQEYSDFAYQLRQLNDGNGKQIILSDWEGDNAIYCGSAYLYVISSDFRQSCESIYTSTYPGNRSPDDTVQGMILWHRARYAGVAAGNARADADGFHSQRIQVAPEISAVHMLSASGYKGILQDVIGHVPFDYISYSAYESLGTPDPTQSLRNDLNTIRDITGTTRIILGEMGYPRSRQGAEIVDITKRVVDAATNWGACYIIQWNLHDQDSTNNFGMYDENDAMTPVGKFYQQLLADSGHPGSEPDTSSARKPACTVPHCQPKRVPSSR